MQHIPIFAEHREGTGLGKWHCAGNFSEQTAVGIQNSIKS